MFDFLPDLLSFVFIDVVILVSIKDTSLVRDPRGTIRKKNPVDIKPICERLQSDIKLAIKLQRLDLVWTFTYLMKIF